MLEVAAIVALILVPPLLSAWLDYRHPDATNPLLPDTQVLVRLVVTAGSFLFTCYVIQHHPGALRTLGLQGVLDGLAASANRGIGSLVYTLAVVSYGIVLLGGLPALVVFVPVFVLRRHLKPSRPTGIERLMTQSASRLGKAGLLMDLELAAVVEELIYRGYLLLVLAEEGLPMWILAAASTVLFALAHEWRGLGRFLYYVWFSVSAIFGLLIFHSVLAPIGLHLFVNLASGLRLWRRSRQRQAAAA